MALILDKTIDTGITYTDEFGNIHENPYLVIDSVIINKLNKYNEIKVFIYKDSTSRINKVKPILETYIRASDDVYDQYFSIVNMGIVNIFEQSYIFAKENVYTIWKSDE